MSKTTEKRETLAEIAARQAPSAEAEARKARMGTVPASVDLASPFLQHRLNSHLIVGYPLGRRGRLSPADTPARKHRRPMELPMPLERYGVAPVLDRLGQLGIAAPKGAAEAFAKAADCARRAKPEAEEIERQMRQAHHLSRSTITSPDGKETIEVRDWLPNRNDDIAAVRDGIAGQLARGEVSVDEARQLLASVGQDTAAQAKSAVWNRLRKDALEHYRTAWQTLQDNGDLLLATLHEIALAAVEQQTKSARPLGDQAARWDLAHETAALLRGWAVPTLDASPLDWRYARPDLAHGWLVEHAADVVPSSRVPLEGTRYTLVLHRIAAVDTPTSDPRGEFAPGAVIDVASAHRDVRRARNRLPVDLFTAAQHADEWRPGVYGAAEVWRTLTTIARAQGQPGW